MQRQRRGDERRREWQRIYVAQRPPEQNERYKLTARFKKYGISACAYSALRIAQADRCAICAEHVPSPKIDHCHDTGAVRGLLCNQCNLAIGLMIDDPARLRAAAAYLESRHVVG